MRFSARSGGDIARTSGDAIVVGLFEESELSPALAAIDAALDGTIAGMRERKELKGTAEELTTIHSLGKLPAARVLVAGLGTPERFSPEVARRAAGVATKALRKANLSTVAFELLGEGHASALDLARAVVEGVALAAYHFDTYRSEAPEPDRLESVEIVARESGESSVTGGIRLGEIMARGTNFARDLVNEPPNTLNPAELAARARAMAEAQGLAAEVFEPDEMRRRGMGALLAVGQGSSNQPRLIVLRYHGDPGNARPALGLVGKGITFDTGGISLKPGQDMHTMKSDMGGAAAMLGAIHAIAELKPALNVTAIVASAENMPDGNAYRPGDILRALNGKTIEIQNTDAEGRLVLADALSYAVELGLAPIVDAATLTGACSVALGPFYAGMFTDDDTTRRRLLDAAKTAGERIWHMPLDPDFRPLLDSSCADMRNIGGREGGAITAAMFLKEFTGDQPWAHLDIAPTAFADNDTAYLAKGLGTGFAVRTLAQLALDLAAV